MIIWSAVIRSPNLFASSSSWWISGSGGCARRKWGLFCILHLEQISHLESFGKCVNTWCGSSSSFCFLPFIDGKRSPADSFPSAPSPGDSRWGSGPDEELPPPSWAGHDKDTADTIGTWSCTSIWIIYPSGCMRMGWFPAFHSKEKTFFLY